MVNFLNSFNVSETKKFQCIGNKKVSMYRKQESFNVSETRKFQKKVEGEKQKDIVNTMYTPCGFKFWTFF